MADKLIGTAIDQYDLFALLADGPVARVYLGWQASVERTVAVKVYPGRLARGRKFMVAFRQQAAVIARLEHINIVPMYGFGEHEGMPYLVFRYFEGGSAANAAESMSGMPPGNVARVVAQISNALKYAHNNEVYHGNIRASNILLDGTGAAYLSDFALRAVQEASSQWYAIAPEALSDQSSGPSEDLYMLGVATFEMLTGQLPYYADDPEELADMHRTQPVPLVSDIQENIPVSVSDVVAQAMAKSPEDRFESPAEFSAALRQAIDQAGMGQVVAFDDFGIEETLPAVDSLRTLAAGEVDPFATMPSDDEAMPQAQSGRKMPLVFGALAGLVVVAGVIGVIIALVVGGAGDLISAAPSPTYTLPPTAVRPTALPPATAVPTAVSTQAEVAPIATEAPQPEATPVSPTVSVPALLPDTFDSFGVPMVLVPAGSFVMGDAAMPDQRPEHEVTLDAFYIDKFEVTNAEFQACILDGSCKPHDETTAPSIFGYFGVDFYAQYPVIFMDWDDANDYCDWRNARLPTEAEWEKAARWDPVTGETRNYSWGDAFPRADLLNYYDAFIGGPVPIDSYPQSASSVGALNLSGNVLEWVADWYDADYYDVSPAVDPRGPDSGQLKVLRGGSFGTTSGGIIASARNPFAPGTTRNDFGFRCALTPPTG